MLLKLERWEEAVKVYETAITLQSDVVQVHHNLGDALLKLQRWDEAVVAYQKAIELNPEFSWSYNNLGDALRTLERWDEVAEAYRKAIELKGDFALSHHNLGDVLVRKEAWEGAIAAYQKAIELDPNFVWSHYNLAASFEQLGQWDEAVEAYRQALKIQPDLPNLEEKLNQALHQEVKGKLEQALSYYRQTIENDPTDIESYQKALEIKPDDAELYLGLGNAWIAKGEVEKAIPAYQSAIRINPGLNEAKFKLEQLLKQTTSQKPLISFDQEQIKVVKYLKFDGENGASESRHNESYIDEELSQQHTHFSHPGPFFEEQDSSLIVPKHLNVDVFAFYLPQFHQIPENDAFWGKNFTEWRQLPRAIPRFHGHYQPRIPRDLGFYTLTSKEVIEQQVDLAKSVGLTGFAFYYYWFDGKRILDLPLEIFLKSHSIDCSFFLIWANENWTRAWNGQEQDVLLKQSYNREDESDLLSDLARHFLDKRYYRINGRPLFVIYNASHVPEPKQTFSRWRKFWQNNFKIDPLFFMAHTWSNFDPMAVGLDGALEFPPHKYGSKVVQTPPSKIYSQTFTGKVFSYDSLVESSLNTDANTKFIIARKIIKTAGELNEKFICYNIESPNQDEPIKVSEIILCGWVLPRQEKEAQIFIEGNQVSQTFLCEIQRDDVTKSFFGNIDPNIKCGFKIKWHYTGTFNISFVVEGEKFLVAQIQIQHDESSFPLIKTVFPSWDNSARKPMEGTVFHGSTPKKYQNWLERIIEWAKEHPVEVRPIVAINAWNEWAEGAYLEPDVHYGAAYLNATKRAIIASSKPCEILFISHDANEGGAQQSFIRIIKFINKHTLWTFRIICLEGGPKLSKFQALGSTLVLEDLLRDTYSPETIAKKILDFCNGTPKLIYANTVASGRVYNILSLIPAKIITHVRELDTSIRKYAVQWMPKVLNYTHEFIACSEAVRQNLINNYGVDKSNIRLVYTCIAPNKAMTILTDRQKQLKRTELGLPTDKVLIAGAGIGMPFRKGADLFISVAEHLHQLGERNFHFVWFGNFDDPNQIDPSNQKDANGRQWSDYIQQLKASSLNEYINFVGFKPDLTQYLQACDIYLMTSREEPFARTVMEAGEVGLPVFGFSGTGGIEEFIDKSLGAIIQNFDTREMAIKVRELILDSSRRLIAGQCARSRVLTRFTEDINFPLIVKACSDYLNRIPVLLEGSVQEIQRPAQAVTLSILVISKTVENINQLLRAIKIENLKEPYEVLCSWNGSDSDLQNIQCPDGIYFHIVEQRPYHFARNNNGLARMACGELLLFINDDVIPDKGAIERSLEAIRNPGVGIVGINLRYRDELLQHAGVFFREDGTSYHRLKRQIRWDDPQLATDMFVPAVTGAFIMMRRAEFEAIQFDETFNVCGEDIALNLSYRENFNREILYLGQATALHLENATRRTTGETLTPPEDMARIVSYSRRLLNGRPITEVRYPRVRIVTEKPGWIMHRMAEEIQKHMGAENVRINEDWEEAEIHYYINYGYFRDQPKNGIKVANFTHYDPQNLAEKFVQVAKEVDHCIAISKATADILADFGIPTAKTTVIVIGADKCFQPLLTLGVVGRTYAGGRKGEDIVKALLEDQELMRRVRIVATNDSWGAPVWQFDDRADFYRAIDYLLVPSRLEGGPVPFMEALACGTMSIAPEIGVIPQFSHISYPVGDINALKKLLNKLADQHFSEKHKLSSEMRGINWGAWAAEHEKLFRALIAHRFW
ncbi:MAG: glycoside hydrolase family 99-like domain-containing protein [Planktothrix sp.]|uniref:glycoside hydrolase family 99-like domain-containing protein n=3 Tax=Planktothrix sp. TaxID=3088171 RepID=UPI0038D44608